MSANTETNFATQTADAKEVARLSNLFDGLRSKLLDMRLSNPMLNYKHTATSKRQVRIVGTTPEQVYRFLATDGGGLDVVPLPEPEGIPADEQSEEFRVALEHAKVSDIEYLAAVAALEEVGRDDEFALAEAETQLRIRLRHDLGLAPRPNRKTVNPIELARSLGIDPSTELKAKAEKAEQATNKLQTLKWPDSLEALLEKIAGDARLAEQEMGLSTLFLAFGFLEWADSKDTSKRLFAPLLLLPVNLTGRKTRSGKIVFTVAAAASAAEDNSSLAKKLLDDFALALPKFEPDEGAPNPVEDYFGAINKLVENQHGWRARRWLILGHFAFGRLAMYADLDPTNWGSHPAGDPLVGAVLRGTEIVGDGGVGLSSPPDDYEVDLREIENVAPFLVQDADASQHSAIIDVMSGKNLVIQGPPGTGKSQTITNVIANALAAGKKVLFLADKMAALEVVKRRLDAVDLGHFCLEMHSDKASPRQIIQSLRLRHQLGYEPSRAAIRPDEIWEEVRTRISVYVRALHAETDVGKPFEQFWRAIRAQGEHGDLTSVFPKTTIPNNLLDSAASFDGSVGRLRLYVEDRASFEKAFGALEISPWSQLHFPTHANPGITYGLVAALRNLRDNLGSLNQEIDKASEFGWVTATDIEAASNIDRLLPSPAPPETWIVALADYDPLEVRALAARVKDFDARTAARTVVDGFDADDAAQFAGANAVLSNLGQHQLGQRPAETFIEARQVVGVTARLQEAMDAAEPAVAALGLAKDFPALALCGVRELAELVEKTPDAFRALVFGSSGPSSETFSAIRSEWLEINAGETRWRARFRSVARAWPSPDMLQAAQAARQKSSLGGWLSKFGPTPKIIAQVSELLGLPATVGVSADDLGQLAKHVQQFREFSSNRAHRLLFGNLWRGLDTQVDEIGACLCRYLVLREKLTSMSGGNEVLRLVDGAGDERLDLLVTCGKILAPWGKLDEATRRIVGDAALAEMKYSLPRRFIRSKRVLDADPSGLTESIDATWSVIGRAIEQVDSLAGLRHHINGHRLSHLIGPLREEPDTIAKTLEWHSSLEQAGIDDKMRVRLRTQGAGALRLRFSDAASKTSRLLAQAIADIKSIQDEFGVSGLSIEQPAQLRLIVDELVQRRDELGRFLSVRSARVEAEEKGLTAFLRQADHLKIANDLLPKLFEGLVAQKRGERIRQHDAVLSIASGQQLQSSRGEFRSRDERKKEHDKKVVFNRVIEKRPLAGSNYGPKKTWTEGAKLNNEFGKQTGFRPLRELLGLAGKSIQEMKPCFLMSPLSLAKFAPPNSLSFDLLVIDEASQMRPEDALGGLLRARQVVVVGDPKQLPPTDFFRRATNGVSTDDGGDGSDGDDESILEACHKTFRQLRLLRWHYRSRCESLIAFSNKEIYAPESRQLITFPAARAGSFSIDRIKVKGSMKQDGILLRPNESLRKPCGS